MKNQIRAYGMAGCLWLTFGTVSHAAIKLADEQAGALRGSPISSSWGQLTAGGALSKKPVSAVLDGSERTIWQADIKAGEQAWIDLAFDHGASWLLTEYVLVNGDVSTSRDPKGWELLGSNDGETWTTIDSRERQYFVARMKGKTFKLQGRDAFNRLRFRFAPESAQLLEVAEIHLKLRAPVLPPSGVSVEAERGRAVVRWQPMPGAAGYTVRRADRPQGPFDVIATGVNDKTFEDIGPFSVSEMSYYAVSSELNGVSGALSGPVSTFTPLNAPTNLRAKQSTDSVVLEWEPAPRAVAYVVRRSLLKEGPFTVIASALTAPAYNDTGLSAGTAYHYVVSGVANGKEGRETDVASVLFPPATPGGLTAEASEETITLTWNPVPLVTHYEVMRSRAPDAPKERVGVVSDATTFEDKTAAARRDYHYTVVAVNDCGRSAESASVSAELIRKSFLWRR